MTFFRPVRHCGLLSNAIIIVNKREAVVNERQGLAQEGSWW